MSAYNSKFYNKLILDAVSSRISSNNVYIYAADGISDIEVPNTASNTISYQLDTLNNIIFGKKILSTEIFKAIRKVEWSANTIYSKYDSSSNGLFESDFFVINTARSIYKCIDNNSGGYSTIEPTSLDPFPTTLSDSYTWQFLYRLTESQLSDLSTSTLLPVVEDSDVIANAVPGTIDFINVSDTGSNYLATHTGDISQVVSNTVFGLASNASSVNSYYTNSSLYISSGPSIGSLAVITNYFSNTLGKYVTVNTSLPSVTLASNYVIAPSVLISGDGGNATARAVTTSNGEISSIEVIDKGEGYTYANVSISANSSWGANASANVIISPLHGHGYDVASELFSNHLIIHIEIDGDELSTIPDTISFSRYGLIGNLKQSANTDAVFSSNTFNNTATANITLVSGTVNVGDTIFSTTNNMIKARVLDISNTNIILQYINKSQFSALDNAENIGGAVITIDNIIQPNVYIYNAEIYSIENITTNIRTDSTKEIINIIIKV